MKKESYEEGVRSCLINDNSLVFWEHNFPDHADEMFKRN